MSSTNKCDKCNKCNYESYEKLKNESERLGSIIKINDHHIQGITQIIWAILYVYTFTYSLYDIDNTRFILELELQLTMAKNELKSLNTGMKQGL